MAERKGGREEEQDRGTKAEHGKGREDEEVFPRGTKDVLGSDDHPQWLKDPKVKSVDVDVAPMRQIDLEQIDSEQWAARPIWQEPRPEEREVPESIDADTEDSDWEDAAPDMEASTDIYDEEDENDIS